MLRIVPSSFRERLFSCLNLRTCLLNHHIHQSPFITSQLTSKTMSSKISAVATKNAPAALSVYSQAIVANGFVYCSGTIPLDIPLIVPGQIPADASGALIDGDIKAHTVAQFLSQWTQETMSS